MHHKYFRTIILYLLIGLSTYLTLAATQTNIQGPPGSRKFGKQVLTLPNGNIIVTDPNYKVLSPTELTDAGAVFLYNGKTGSLISQLTGAYRYAQVGGSVTVLTNGNFVVTGGVWNETYSALMGAARLCNGTTGCNGDMLAANSLVGNKPDDYVPGLVTPLSNGNYLLSSPSWDNGSIVDAGALTFCDGITGCTGVVSPANSLVGGNDNDQLGGTCDPCPRGILTLPNGNYIVSNTRWNNGRGAVTFGNGATGVTGVVSPENSLVGGSSSEKVGYSNPNTIGVVVLTNNNYVVSTAGAVNGRGAATLCSGVTGCSGFVTAANSLIGANFGDSTGYQVIALNNGNFVVMSPEWDISPNVYTVGAVTFCSGTTGRIETVSPANSLVGSNANDRIGEFGIQALANGGYIVKSPNWRGGYGAVTFGNGTSGVSGTISSQNSLVGTRVTDHVGERQFAILTNGNYALASEKWFDGRGAVTFFNGNTGISGEISAANSLVGSTAGDSVGKHLIALTNGNYVVGSPGWDNGPNNSSGAATFCSGTTGCTGEITPENSLIGNAGDTVSGSYQGLKALTNGNYVVVSSFWNNNRGAVTWGNGTTGTTGIVSADNSLVGQTVNDNVGSEGVVALTNGNYVVNTSFWNNGSATRAGAVTWGNGTTGTTGVVSGANSLIGSTANDIVGFDSSNQGLGGAVFPLSNGGYVVRSLYWDNGSIYNAGAVSLGRASQPVSGVLSDENSVRSTISQPGYLGIVFAYDYRNSQLVVGRPDSNVVTLFRYDEPKTAFDFDGDGKTDISIFRPGPGEWWYSRSSDGQVPAAQFGSSSDKPVPADFTGDGKTDIAVWRPSTGEWFILRSEDGSFFSTTFGQAGDTPLVGDFDADGKADIGVFRNSTGEWFVQKSTGGFIILTFGTTGDRSVPADYDGDGKTDIGIFRPSDGSWWHLRSSDLQYRVFVFGVGTDKPVQGDYTGDGKADIAFWRPSTGEWFIQRSEDNSFYSVPFGQTGDIPSPGDYDGDGRFDSAVFRPNSATWFINRSTAGILIANFGTAGDRPVPNVFVP